MYHDVILTGLQDGGSYAYSAGSTSGGWSNVFTFTAPKLAATSFTVAVYGDMGISNSEATTGALPALSPLSPHAAVQGTACVCWWARVGVVSRGGRCSPVQLNMWPLSGLVWSLCPRA